MTTDIQLLRSAVAYKRPAAAPLLDGQAAVNYNSAEPGLFFRLTSGGLMKIGPVAMTTDGSRPNSAATGETGNSLGEQWLNALPTLYRPVQYVFDGNEFVTANGFTVDEATGNFLLERTLRSQRLEAGTLLVEGPAAIGGNITPNGQNCAYFLGMPTERWDVGYLCGLDVSGDITFGTDCTDTFTVTAATEFNCDVTFNGAIDIDTIGRGCGVSTLTVDAVATFNCDTTFDGDVTFNGTVNISQLSGPNITLGDGCGASTVTANAEVTFNCDATPATDGTVNLGSPTNRFANVYTGDLHLRNERGDWTVIEEEEYLSLHNNKTGKTYRLVMEEV